MTPGAAFLLRSPACPSCCSRRTSCSAPRTRAGCLWALSEAPSTSCSCWSRGAASTCTRCAPPQVGSGHRGVLGVLGVRGWGSAPCPRRVLCVPALAGLWGVLMGRGEPRLGGGHSAHLGGGCGVPPGTAEAVYLLASSADGNWLAAVSGDWEIHVYSLKHFKVGEGAGCTAPLGQEGEVPRGRDCPRVPPALSPPVSAPLHGAHVQLCGDSPRHPPGHQQPRHRLRGPAGRGCPRQDPVPTQRSARLGVMPGGWLRGHHPHPLSLPRSSSSSASPRSSTRPGAARCRTAGCTKPGWRGTRPSPTSPSTPRTPRTSCCTTSTCSASSINPW